MNIEIKDIAGLKDPILKLIDVIGNGISAISAPWMYKRLERAKLQIAEESATLNRNIKIKDALANQFEEKLLAGRDQREWKNILDVIGISEKLLQSDQDVNDTPVNPDWAARFFDNVKYCSDEEVKNMWANILAGEIKAPGKFSFRTLDSLKNLTKDEAQLIIRYSSRIIGDMLVDVKDQNHVLNYSTLEDIGFIIGTDLIRSVSISPNAKAVLLNNSDFVLIVENKSSREMIIKYSCKKVTKFGLEIMNLINIQDDDLFHKEFAKEILMYSKEFNITKHKIISKEADANVKIHFNSNPIWTLPGDH